MNCNWDGVEVTDPPLWLRELLPGGPFGAMYPMAVCEDCLIHGPCRYRSPIDGGIRCARCTVAWHDSGNGHVSGQVESSEAVRTP